MLPRRARASFLAFLLLLALLATAPAAREPATELSEVSRWLQGYLRIDTSNPPGGERPAAEYLARILHREGIATRMLFTPEGRPSLYARLAAGPGAESAGAEGAGAVLLLHHMDVVPAGPGWTRPPFGGEVADGRLWGRGAIDAKSLGIAHLAALVELKRGGVALERDVVFLAVADEESGGGRGTRWLFEHHAELFDGVGVVFNEGGTNLVLRDRLLWWGIEFAQKRPLWLEVEAAGRGGHGSGFHPASAVHELIRALDRVLAIEPRWHVSGPVKTYLEALAPLQNEKMRRTFLNLDEAIAEEGPRATLMPGMANLFLDSLQVTELEGSERINVVPEAARARLDIRLLPDTDAEAYLATVREALGQRVRARVLLSSPPAPPSPPDSPFFLKAAEVLGEEALVVPAFIGGFTDSRYFRARGIPAYGISPFALAGEDLRGIHGTDERIPLAEFDRGVERTLRLVRAWAAPVQSPR